MLTDTQGSGQQVLNVGRTENYKPQFSPDGNKIVFFGPVPEEGEEQYDVFTYNLNNEKLARLTDDPRFDGDPKWTSDGNHVVYASSRDGRSRILTMVEDGSGKQLLFPGRVERSIAPVCANAK